MTSATEDNDGDLFLALGHRLDELTTYHGESNRAAITRLAVRFLDRTGPRASARDALIWLAREGWDLDDALNRWEAEADGADGQDHEDQPPNKRRRVEGSDEDDDGYDGGRGDAKGKGKEKGKGKSAER